MTRVGAPRPARGSRPCTSTHGLQRGGVGQEWGPPVLRPGFFPFWICVQRGWCSTGLGMHHQLTDLWGQQERWVGGHVGAVDGTHMNTHTRMNTPGTQVQMCTALAHTHQHTRAHPWRTRTSSHPQTPPSLFPPPLPKHPPWHQGAPTPTVSPHPRHPLHHRSPPVGATLSPPSLWDPPEPGTVAVPPPRSTRFSLLSPRGHPHTPTGTSDNGPGGLRESGEPGCALPAPLARRGVGVPAGSYLLTSHG